MRSITVLALLSLVATPALAIDPLDLAGSCVEAADALPCAAWRTLLPHAGRAAYPSEAPIVPTASGTLVFAAVREGNPPSSAVEAIDSATGAPLWTSAWLNGRGVGYAGEPSGLAANEDVAILLLRGFQVAAFDLADGSMRWYVDVVDGNRFREADALALDADAGVAYAAGVRSPTEGGARLLLAAIDAASGARRWTTDLGRGGTTLGIGTAGDLVYVLAETSRGGSLFALRALDGSVAWTRSFARDDAQVVPLEIAVSPDESKLAVVTGVFPPELPIGEAPISLHKVNAALAVLDAATGAIRWTFEAPTAYYSASWPYEVEWTPSGESLLLAVAPGTCPPVLLCVDACCEILRFEATTGEIDWVSNIPYYAWDLEVASDGKRFLVAQQHLANPGLVRIGVSAFDLETGALQWVRSTGAPERDTRAPNLALAPDGSRALVSAASGAPAWTNEQPFAAAFDLP